MASYDIKDIEPCISRELSSVLSYYDYATRNMVNDKCRELNNVLLLTKMIAEKLDIELDVDDLMIAYDYISGKSHYK